VGSSDAPAFQKIYFNGQEKETRPRKRMAAPLRGRGEFFVVWVRPKQDEIEMEAGAWGQRGLVPAWEGEVVHPGVPESQCVYKTRCYRIWSVPSLYGIDSIKPRYHMNSRTYKEP
jgi:hypothetical protein